MEYVPLLKSNKVSSLPVLTEMLKEQNSLVVQEEAQINGGQDHLLINGKMDVQSATSVRN